jgi:peptidoglycan/xylan/chitin deacetylase (PgdA/CDA1 family)
MPWKTGHTISDERTVADHDVHWPDGRSCWLRIIVDLSPTCDAGGLKPSDFATPESYYGMHQGLDALLSTLEHHRLRATFAVPAVVAALHPHTVQATWSAGHEIAAGGWKREDVSVLSAPDELDRIRRTTELLADVVGERPHGWFALPRASDPFATGSISDHTVPLLLREGYTYLGNSPADDLPHYWVTSPDGPRAILALPYDYALDDAFFLLFPAAGTGLENPDVLDRNRRAELAAQHRRGRAATITLNANASGWPHRRARLEAFLSYATSLPGIWNATSREAATHWQSQHPPDDLVIEPSIWQQHDDSVN